MKSKEEIIKEEMGKSTNITLSQMICSAMDEYANQLKEENARLREVLERCYIVCHAGATSPESARYHQSPTNYDQPDLDKLYEWLMDENRKKAQTYFTAGVARNIAREIEFRLWQSPVPATPQPVSLTIGSSRFKEWLEGTIKTLEAEKEFHGKKERIMARLSALTEVLENYNRWQPVSLEWVKATVKIPTHDNNLPCKVDGQYAFGNFFDMDGDIAFSVNSCPDGFVITKEKFNGLEWLSESGEKGKELEEARKGRSKIAS